MTLPRRAAAWLEAAHFFPTVAVVSLTALVGLVSGDKAPDTGQLGIVVLAMFLSQLCIGWTNDYLDRDTDARFQPDKPVPSGRVPAGPLRLAEIAAGAASLLVALLLGWHAWLLLAAGTACGLAYDFGLKRTPLSALAYLAALAILPLYVWTALDQLRSDLLWLYLVGLPLPLAAHLANALPDLQSDAGSGGRGLVVVLGRARSIALLAACLLAAPLLLLLTTLRLTYDAVPFLLALPLYGALSLASLLLLRRGDRDGAVSAFRLVGAAGVLFTAAWLLALE